MDIESIFPSGSLEITIIRLIVDGFEIDEIRKELGIASDEFNASMERIKDTLRLYLETDRSGDLKEPEEPVPTSSITDLDANRDIGSAL